MFNYYVYILKCADKSYYTGVTNNIERRVYEHNASPDNSTYTYNKRPIELVFYQAFKDVNQTIAFEKQVKGWTRKKKDALIENNWDKIKELAVCINESSHLNYKKSETPFASTSTPLSMTAQGDKT